MRRFPVLLTVCLALSAGLCSCGAQGGSVSGPYVGGAGGGSLPSH